MTQEKLCYRFIYSEVIKEFSHSLAILTAARGWGHPTPKAGKWWPHKRWKSHWSWSSLGSNWLWKVESTCWGTSSHWKWSDKGQPWGNLKQSSMPCWPKLVSIITVTTVWTWAQHVDKATEHAHGPSQSQAIPLSSDTCQNRRVNSNSCTILL